MAATQPESPMERVKDLMSRKDEIEKELRESEAELSRQGIGMSEPLVDAQGFPRNDIDLVAARTLRHQIIVKKNDYKQIMADIEKALIDVHEQNKSVNSAEPTGSVTSAPQSGESIPSPLHRPLAFAIVNAVAPDSPAKDAGLERSDRIVRFGSVHAGNHRQLQALNEVVLQNEGRAIDVTISRNNQELKLQLTPRRGWGGRGMLGCHLLPL